VSAQISEEGLPVSYSTRMLKSAVSIPEHELHTLNAIGLPEEDSINSIPNRYSEFEDVNINLTDGDGANTNFDKENSQIWQDRIVSDNSYYLLFI
jgi:hypothetical protein